MSFVVKRLNLEKQFSFSERTSDIIFRSTVNKEMGAQFFMKWVPVFEMYLNNVFL